MKNNNEKEIERINSLEIKDVQHLRIDMIYSILNIKATSSNAETKSAFRKLSLMVHPDKNPGIKGSNDAFIRLNEAYEQSLIIDASPHSTLSWSYSYWEKQEQQFAKSRKTYTAPPPPPPAPTGSPREVSRINRLAKTSIYEILDIKSTATAREVKKAFKRLVNMVHPDKNSAKDTSLTAYEKLFAAYKVAIKIASSYFYWDSGDPVGSFFSSHKYSYPDSKIPTQSRLYSDIRQYPPNGMTMYDWEEDHPYKFDDGIRSHTLVSDEQDWSKAIKAKRAEMIALCMKDDRVDVILNMSNGGSAQWQRRAPFIYKISKSKTDIMDKGRRFLEICYLTEDVYFSILRIDFGSIVRISDFLFTILRLCTPVPTGMSMGSCFRVSEYTPKIENSLGLSYFPQAGEALRERLFLTSSSCDRGTYQNDLNKLYPIIMNLIFALQVIKKINFFSHQYVSTFEKNKEHRIDFEIFCLLLFSSEFLNEKKTSIIRNCETHTEVGSILVKDCYFPVVLKNIVNEYVDVDVYEVLLRPQVISLLEKKMRVPPPAKEGDNLEQRLDSILSALKAKGVIRDEYKVVGANVSYDKFNKTIVPYNGYFCEFSYRDICAVFEYLEHGIAIPMYPLGALSRKQDNLKNALSFFQETKGKVDRKRTLTEMINISSDMQSYPYYCNTMKPS